MGHTPIIQQSESVLRMREGDICCIEKLEIYTHLKF
jgi:hypothetical protein